MKRHAISRFVTAVLLGILFGSYMHHDYVTWGQRGREAFASHQMHRFDLHMATPQAAIFPVLGATFVAVGLFGIYEAIALGLSTALKAVVPDEGTG
jgi:hypothetical protein